MRFAAFDRWGSQIGTVTGIVRAEWAEELNGEDTLTVDAYYPLAKGNRIVWCDHMGIWHEHTVASVSQSHDGDGDVLHTATCENSISELYGDFIADKRPQSVTASTALATALEPTRWQVGTVTVTGSNSTNFYRESAREAVQKVVETWGGELSTTVTVNGAAVTSRKVNLTRRGTDNGKRFAYGKDMASIRRTFDADDVVTALYGFGKGQEVGDGHGRGIDFASVNGGKQYVEDAAARSVWGRPDGKGGKAHVFGKVEFSDCEDPRELLKLTKAEFEKRKAPKVSYEASVSVFAGYGYEFEGVGIGDDVALIDRAFYPEVRVKGRVTRIVRDLLDGGKPTDIVIGNVVEDAADMIAQQYAALQSLAGRATSWDVAAYTPSAYINQIIDGLNKEFDAGASYIYQSPEQGIIIGSVPLDLATGKPTRTPASAIQLKGGGFRIANAVKSNGEFDWRTFGTGAGFTADEIIAGVIRGGSNTWNLSTGDLSFRRGSIGSADGRSYWDMTAGTIRTYGMTAASMTATDLKATRGTLESMTARNLNVESGDISKLRAGKVGTSSTHYMTTGTTQAGNPGASFVNQQGNYCDVEALHAEDSPAGQTNGTGFACFDKPFMSASVFYNRVWMFPPTYANTYLKQPPEQMMMKRGGNVYLQRSDKQGVFFGDGYAMMKLDDTHYVRISSEGVQCRCGTYGFGWSGGKFFDNLDWS